MVSLPDDTRRQMDPNDRADVLVEAPSGIRFKFNQPDADSYLKGVPGARIITPEMLAAEKARARGESEAKA